MTGMALADRQEPEPQHPVPPHPAPHPAPQHVVQTLDLQAGAALSAWLSDHPGAARELEEAAQARMHLQELDARASAAHASAADAERRAASTVIKLDPAGHKALHPVAAGFLLTALMLLDVLPLNWAAQAFDLPSGGSWLVTSILVVGSIAAMAALELTRQHQQRRGLLLAAIGIACLALIVLRTEYLTTVRLTGLTDALLQSVLLTAISGCLILCGSMILSRTRLPRMARAQSTARRARRAADDRAAARTLAAERMQRHFGALRQMMIPWALSSPPPAGVDHVSWTAALERAVRGLFAGF